MESFDCTTANIITELDKFLKLTQFRNLEKRHSDCNHDIVRSQLFDKILYKSPKKGKDLKPYRVQFCEANNREAWTYRVYRNLLLDEFRKLTIRDHALLLRKIENIEEQLDKLIRKQMGSLEDMSESINELMDDLRIFRIHLNKMEGKEPVSSEFYMTGCPTYCLEKLAKEKPIHCAIFMVKYLDYTPAEIRKLIIKIAGGTSNLPKNVIDQLHRMVQELAFFEDKLRKNKRDVTEAEIATLLGRIFDFTPKTVGVYLSKSREILQECVENCEKNSF